MNNKRFYLDPSSDKLQDRLIGDFRGYARSLVKLTDPVLEFGPSYLPVFPRREGYNVEIVDHTDQAGLLEKYGAMGCDISLIEKVDHVWAGRLVSEIVTNHHFSYVFASHVVEHVPDLVCFLNDCAKLLSKEGHIILIVPDKRYCFDLLQPLTDPAKVIADSIRSESKHSIEALYREESQVSVSYNNKDVLAWWQGAVDDYRFMHQNPINRYKAVLDAQKETAYQDAHEYYFTPSSFLLILEELRHLGLTNVKIDLITRARGCEFLVILKPDSAYKDDMDTFISKKLALNLNVMREQIEAWNKLKPINKKLPDWNW